MPTKADQHLALAYRDLGLEDRGAEAKYQAIYQIRDHLFEQNRAETIAVGTTGTISERLCALALEAAVPDIYFRLPARWKWVGDYYVLGEPFNTVVSVKSFKAKERLLVSGSGNLLSPTIGFGLFDDPGEFSVERLEQYKYRAFIGIYVPRDRLLEHLPLAAAELENINGHRLLRPVEGFIGDLRRSTRGQGHSARLDPMAL